MPHVTTSPRRNSAFTLTELLTVIAIIAVLAGIMFPVIGKVRAHADRTSGLSHIRHVGLAIQLYAADHKNYLPGPLWSGQVPTYSNNATERSLGSLLWSYLGIPEPKSAPREEPLLGSPAYFRERQGTWAASYLMNLSVENSQGAQVIPWGYINSDNVSVAPNMNMLQLSSAGFSNTWAMADVDQTCTQFASTTWYAALPKTPLYGNSRLTLNFDGSAKFVPVGSVP